MGLNGDIGVAACQGASVMDARGFLRSAMSQTETQGVGNDRLSRRLDGCTSRRHGVVLSRIAW